MTLDSLKDLPLEKLIVRDIRAEPKLLQKADGVDHR